MIPGGPLSYTENFSGKKHNVNVDSFYICKYELTQGEYERVVGILPRENYMWTSSLYVTDGPTEVKGDSIPVRGTYRFFVEYCNYRSRQDGYDGFYEINGDSIKILPDGNGYRLVTPYEWIFAAYGGNLNKVEKYLGGETLSDVAWHLGNSNHKPHPVGLKKTNVLGIYDMQGNACELLQGGNKHECYFSMLGSYLMSNWNYPQTYDPTHIYYPQPDESDYWCYGTRIALVPKCFNNNNLRVQYELR